MLSQGYSYALSGSFLFSQDYTYALSQDYSYALSQDGWDDIWPHGLPLRHHPPPLAPAAHSGPQQGEGQQTAGGAGRHLEQHRGRVRGNIFQQLYLDNPDQVQGEAGDRESRGERRKKLALGSTVANK